MSSKNEPTDSAPTQDSQPTELHWHEMLDRADQVQQYFATSIAEHSCAPRLEKEIKAAANALNALYQAAGVKRFDYAPPATQESQQADAYQMALDHAAEYVRNHCENGEEYAPIISALQRPSFALGQAGSVQEPGQFDLQRMAQALVGESVVVPPGLSRDETRKFIMGSVQEPVIKESFTTGLPERLAWCDFTEDGNIRMWAKSSPESIKQATGRDPIPLYRAPVTEQAIRRNALLQARAICQAVMIDCHTHLEDERARGCFACADEVEKFIDKEFPAHPKGTK